MNKQGKHTPGKWMAKLRDTQRGYSRYVVMGGEDGQTEVAVTVCTPQGVNARLIAAAPDLLAACEEAAQIIKTARQYFPKSMHNADAFALENTCATVTAAIANAHGKDE